MEIKENHTHPMQIHKAYLWQASNNILNLTRSCILRKYLTRVDNHINTVLQRIFFFNPFFQMVLVPKISNQLSKRTLTQVSEPLAANYDHF